MKFQYFIPFINGLSKTLDNPAATGRGRSPHFCRSALTDRPRAPQTGRNHRGLAHRDHWECPAAFAPLTRRIGFAARKSEPSCTSCSSCTSCTSCTSCFGSPRRPPLRWLRPGAENRKAAPKKFGTAIVRRVCASVVEKLGGAKEDRTPDLLNAIQTLYQLSYSPKR